MRSPRNLIGPIGSQIAKAVKQRSSLEGEIKVALPIYPLLITSSPVARRVRPSSIRPKIQAVTCSTDVMGRNWRGSCAPIVPNKGQDGRKLFVAQLPSVSRHAWRGRLFICRGAACAPQNDPDQA